MNDKEGTIFFLLDKLVNLTNEKEILEKEKYNVDINLNFYEKELKKIKKEILKD